MRQSNVCSPAQNQACLLITSRLYDRRGLDCTSPLPLFNSLAHLVHLTATSPKIREILTRDGGLERLVRILRDFVASPPPVQDPASYYGLLPPTPHPNAMPPQGGNVQIVPGSLGYGSPIAHSSLTPGSPTGLPHPGMSTGVNNMSQPPIHSNWLPAALQQSNSQPASGLPLPNQGAIPHQQPPPVTLAPYPPTLGFSFSTFSQPGNSPNALPLTAPPHISAIPSIPPPNTPNVLNHPRPSPTGPNPAPTHMVHIANSVTLNHFNAATLSTRPFDREAAQRFSLAFQCIVNVGVRGSEVIRSRVVQAGTLDVVASVLEAWLVAKGFPLVVPSRRSKKREGPAGGGTIGNSATGIDSRANGAIDDDTEMQEEEEPTSRASFSAAANSVPSTRARTTTLTPRTARGTTTVPAHRSTTATNNGPASASTSATSRAASFSANASAYSYPNGAAALDGANVDESITAGIQPASRISAHSRTGSSSRSVTNLRTNGPSTTRVGSTVNGRTSSTTTRPGSSSTRTNSSPSHSRNTTITASNENPSNTSNSASQTTPRFSSYTSLTSTANSSPSTSNTSLPPDTPSPADSTASTSQEESLNPLRGRSGTIIAHRQNSISSTTSREQSEDDNDADAEGDESAANRNRRRNNRLDSGANTEESDADMEADSSNPENDSVTDRASTVVGAPTAAVVGNPNAQIRPVAVADPQALSPTMTGGSLPGGVGIGMGMGNGMGMEVDVLAAVNMVMAVDGVAAFEGTQFGGDMGNAAAAEAAARAVGEGTMVENTPRAVLRNMTMLVGDGGNLGGVDEEMGEMNANANRTPHASRSSISESRVSLQMQNITNEASPTTTTTAAPVNGDNNGLVDGPAALNEQEDATNTANPQAAAANNGGANASVNSANANRNRLRIMVGDAGPFRQEDVLRALQLLAYLTKYPHVRQEFYKKRIQVIPPNLDQTQSIAQPLTPSRPGDASSATFTTPPSQGANSHLAAVTPSAAPQTQITTLFSLVERFTFRPSVSHLNLHPSIIIPTIPPEIQSWAAVIMRNACRKDDSQGGIRQCANMTCGKWEKSPREFAKCRRCRKAKYCGKECQSKAWSMGHRYWCSAREGEQGQVPENLDQENEDGGGVDHGNNNPGNVSIAVATGTGVGVGFTHIQPVTAPNRAINDATVGQGGQLPTTRTNGVGFPTPVQRQTPNGQGFTPQAGMDNGGPVVVYTSAYRNGAWPGLDATTTNGQNANAAGGPPVPTANNLNASGSGTVRRRDGNGASTSATSASASRFVWDRLRALGGNSGTSNAPLSSSTPTTSLTANQQDSSGMRSRAWDRFFSRDAASTSSSSSAAQTSTQIASTSTSHPTGVQQRPARPSRSNSSGAGVGEGATNDTNQGRQFMSLASRSRGAGMPPGYTVDDGAAGGSTASTAPSDLPGMVRNNLVLASQANHPQRLLPTLGRRSGSGPPNLLPTGRPNSMFETPRAGVIGRSTSATAGSPAVVDPSTASGLVWTHSATDPDVNMD